MQSRLLGQSKTINITARIALENCDQTIITHMAFDQNPRALLFTSKVAIVDVRSTCEKSSILAHSQIGF
jgi:hypothetical protein